ncbi:MAG: NAD(P)-binding domain-containing protein [Deltaproteobacteria bacterium]|nr:NAD(P)-binding domain-containing protein [Deltaproteobacteria bacterium]
MKIGVIGAGQVGATLGRRMAEAGHTVSFGVRDPGDPKHAALVEAGASVHGVREAVDQSDLILLATPWAAAEDAVRAAGDFAGKVLVDATNPIGPGLTLLLGQTDSGAEQVARWATGARVVKAFNTTGFEVMADPTFGDARAVMLVAGDDEGACEVVCGLARELGFEALRLGGLARARVLEPMALAWIELALVRGQGRGMAFGLLRRSPG